MLLNVTYAAEHEHDETKMICRPFGRCEPCPEDSVRIHNLTPHILRLTPHSFTNRFANRLVTDGWCTAPPMMIPRNPPPRYQHNNKTVTHHHREAKEKPQPGNRVAG